MNFSGKQLAVDAFQLFLRMFEPCKAMALVGDVLTQNKTIDLAIIVQTKIELICQRASGTSAGAFPENGLLRVVDICFFWIFKT